MLKLVNVRSIIPVCAALATLIVFTPTACRKEQQAVVGVAQNAANAEHKAQAKASELDAQRDQLEQIPLPTKSLYVDIHDQAQWANPFLIVGPDTLTLRVQPAQTSPAPAGKGKAHPAAPAAQEMQVQPADLARTIAGLPVSAWRYGRVIAVAESPSAAAKDRQKIRKNEEAAIQQLNDLGVVVQEWPAK